MFAKESKRPRTYLRPALLSALLGLTLFLPTCFANDVEVNMFGPKQYLGTTDKISFYSDSFRGVPGKGKVIIQNGDGNGNNLVKDALVLINGMPVFDSSQANQPGYQLESPMWMGKENWIWVLLVGEPGSYISIQAAAEITPDATSTQVIGINGGTVSVQNHLGDTFTLQIPPLALDEDTPISVSALPEVLPSPMADSAYPGAVLEPEGQLFSVPVTMTVTLHETPQNSNPAMLFWFEDSSHVLPMGNQTTTPNSVAGQNFHFSTEIGAFPTPGELALNIAQILTGGPGMPATPGDQIIALMSIAAYAQGAEALNPAFGPVFESAWNAGMTVEEKAAQAELNSALPPDPCQQKITINNVQLSIGLQYFGADELAQEILLRDCNLVLDPPSLDLLVGQTWQKGISATLFDPNGKARSCLPIAWYDSNQSVVTLASSGSVSIPTGVAPGIASVGANCAGFSGTSLVKVGGLLLVGKWTGTGSYNEYPPDPTQATSVIVNATVTQQGNALTATIAFVDDTGLLESDTATGQITGQTLSIGPIVTAAGDRVSVTGTYSTNGLSFSGSGTDITYGGSQVTITTASGTLTVSADGNTITGNATTSDGQAATWTMTRQQ